jgi:toxin YoeB
MGEFKVILSDRAKKDLLIIERSGDKASIKKVEQIIAELDTHLKPAPVSPNA